MGLDRAAMAAMATMAALLPLGGTGDGAAAGRGSVTRTDAGSHAAVAAAEVRRIRLHLGNVETALRAGGTGSLSVEQRMRRAAALDWLREYRERGLFPHNHTRPGERVPVFVDEHGTHCAVGYLLKRSGETGLVRDVVAADNNIRVRDLADNERFRSWLKETGLTLEEAAWIQPAYDGRDHDDLADAALIVYGGLASGSLALYSHLTEPGPREFQVAGTLNAAVGLFNLGVAAWMAGREGPFETGRIAISGVFAAVSVHASVSRFLGSRERRAAFRAEAAGQAPGAALASPRGLRVSLPEPSWVHGRPGIRLRAVH